MSEDNGIGRQGRPLCGRGKERCRIEENSVIEDEGERERQVYVEEEGTVRTLAKQPYQ